MHPVTLSAEIFSEIPLGSAITLQRGFDITKAEQTPGEVPIVSSSGVSSFHNNWKVIGPGVVIGRKGTLGTVHYLRENFWPHDTTLWVKDFKQSNPRFVAYFLKTLWLENFDTGASNPTLNRNHVHKIRVQYPKPAVQERIAAVLSAYDDLIENNRRRIALLEQMAEQFYREWFVRFRFPGYQQAKFERGIPAGWLNRSLRNLTDFYIGGGWGECLVPSDS
jgi:type I restriction enzyme S subunit